MLERANCGMLLVGSALVLASSQACAEDPELERRGGDDVPSPVAQGEGGVDSVSGGGGTADSGLVPFCDALTVIRAKCQRCHGNPLNNGAPAPFLTYEDTQAPYYMTDDKWTDVMPGVIERGFMPYVALNDPPTNLMPPVEPLTPEEKATLLAWLKQGALPVGGTDCP